MNEHRATYSPEDNKLRLYAACRLSDEEYRAAKAAGFRWAPKQECFVAPKWTPAREDYLLSMVDEIGDEDYSYEERAADRAERFTGYRDKRSNEAHDLADKFDSGPAAFGHQNRQRAERQASRHDRLRCGSVSQWSKAEYWQRRTAGVISHALYKSSARVRRGRILALESEHRKAVSCHEADCNTRDLWQSVANEPDASKANAKARALASAEIYHWDYKHPRTGDKASLWRLLDEDNADPITGHEAAALYLGRWRDPRDENAHTLRCIRHLELRLTYEKAMLAEEGGMAGDVDMEPGGWVCYRGEWRQIQKVNKSNATKRVTSVYVWGKTSGYTRESGYKDYATWDALHRVNVGRLPEDAYRAPTDEERKAFAAEQKKRKAEAKANAPKSPKLINPTQEDAERLQSLLNAAARAEHDAKSPHSTYEPGEVRCMTQAEYSALSKGAYARFETRLLHACGRFARKASNMWSSSGQAYDNSLAEAVCKLRIREGRGWYGAVSIVVLTDKPQKTIPWGFTPAQQKEAC